MCPLWPLISRWALWSALPLCPILPVKSNSQSSEEFGKEQVTSEANTVAIMAGGQRLLGFTVLNCGSSLAECILLFSLIKGCGKRGPKKINHFMLLMSGTITVSVQRSKSTCCMSRILQISKVGSWVMNLCSRLFLLARYFVVYCKRALSMKIKDKCLSAQSEQWMGCLQRRLVSNFNCLTSQVLCSACSWVSLASPHHVLCLSLQRRREAYTSVSFMLNCSAFCSYRVNLLRILTTIMEGKLDFHLFSYF